MARAFVIAGPDFACPHGVPWGVSYEPLPPVVATPREQWPKWAALLARWKKREDRGVGDTFHRMAGKAGALYETLRKRFGVPCSCADRRVTWNALYPYQNNPA